MKNLFVLTGMLLILVFSGCKENQLTEPAASLDKASLGISNPFMLYQTFPELTRTKIDWYNNAKGLVITVNAPAKMGSRDELFAVIEFTDADDAYDPVQMVYLGNITKSIYLIRGIKNRIVSNVKIYVYANYNINDQPAPYPDCHLFWNVGVNDWSLSDDNSFLKVSSEQFPSGLRHLFAELKVEGGNTLIFLGKPYSEDFEFPLPRLNVTYIRLFGCIKTNINDIP